MSSENFSDGIYRAPNDKFYALSQGEVVCTPNGGLRYFETEYEAQAFLNRRNAGDSSSGEFAICSQTPLSERRRAGERQRRRRSRVASPQPQQNPSPTGY
jgi:hypothetical protein